MLRSVALLCFFAAASAASPPGPPTQYVIASGACDLDYAGSKTQRCALDDVSLSGNTLRAGLVWSGSVRGDVPVEIGADERRAMRVGVGAVSNESLVSVSCTSQDTCSQLTLTVGDATLTRNPKPSITLGWAVLSLTKPPAGPAEKSILVSLGFIVMYVYTAVILLIGLAVAGIVYSRGSRNQNSGGGASTPEIYTAWGGSRRVAKFKL